MSKMKIRAAAKYVPRYVVTNDDISVFVDTSDEWIFSRTGIKQRFISKDEDTSELSVQVAVQLLEKSGLSPLDIDLIIVATITPDYLTPSVSCLVQGRIGAKNALAFDVNAACSGFVYAFSVAEKFIASGKYNRVMLIGADVLSKVFDWEDRTTCVLFGDGAGGVLLESSDTGGILAEDLHSDGSNALAITAEYFNEISLKMDGRKIYDFATREAPKNIMSVLEKSGTAMDEVKYIIAHQANKRIIDAVAKKLKLDISKFYINIETYGNTTAATIPIAIAEMAEKGLITFGSGEKIIITGFGSGLTWGSILIQI